MARWRRLREWRTWELAAKLAVDAGVVFVSFVGALLLRFDSDIPTASLNWFFSAYPFVACLYLSVNYIFGIYRRWWRYAGLQDAFALATSVGVSTVTLLVVDFLFFAQRNFPLSVVLIGGGISLMAFGLSKLQARVRKRFVMPWSGRSDGIRLLIVGGGKSGQMLAHELLQHREWGYRPVCFVDDDRKKRGMKIHGLPVRGGRADIPDIVVEHAIDFIAIAIPSATGPAIRELVTICQATNAKIGVVPGVPEMMSGQTKHAHLRDLTVTDLLGRNAVQIDANRCRRSIAGKTVVVTGAAGSIGQELCRQLLPLGPAALIAVDNNESGLFDLSVELATQPNHHAFEPRIMDVADGDKIDNLFSSSHPQVVFHAAAYKHVPLMEDHVSEAYRVNIQGTLNVCLAAQRYACERLTFISSDKAVKPSSVMGATKRIGELMIAEIGRHSETSFCAVRFGNVLGSRGSVVPTFWHQIEAGGPVTVTDAEASRFFMTIAEAASLVIQAATFARSGEIFLLDMGEEIKIVDLAHKMIRLKGLRPGEDIEVVFTGLRPGEKLREVLAGEAEQLLPTDHPKVLRVVSLATSSTQLIVSRARSLGSERDGPSREAVFALLESDPVPLGVS